MPMSKGLRPWLNYAAPAGAIAGKPGKNRRGRSQAANHRRSDCRFAGRNPLRPANGFDVFHRRQPVPDRALGSCFSPPSRRRCRGWCGTRAQEKIPLIPRERGTGLAGESLGQGLVIDFSRHMRQIEAIGETTVRVQPGVVCRTLNDALRKSGRYFPPDPSGAGVTTVGSMLSLDAAGSHSLRIGSTRDHVESIEMVLASGQFLTAGDEPIRQNAPGRHG